MVGSPKARRLLALLAARRGQVVAPEAAGRRAVGRAATRAARAQRRDAGEPAARAARAPTSSRATAAGTGWGRRAWTSTRRRGSSRRPAAGSRQGRPPSAASAAGRALGLLGSGAALVGSRTPTGWTPCATRSGACCAPPGTAPPRPRCAPDAAARRWSSPRLPSRDDRFDETAHRLLMRAYREVGEPARALTTYSELAAALRDELGVEPAPQTRRVHLASSARKREGTTAPASARNGASGVVGRDAELAQLGCGLGGGVPGAPHRRAARGRGRDGQDRGWPTRRRRRRRRPAAGCWSAAATRPSDRCSSSRSSTPSPRRWVRCRPRTLRALAGARARGARRSCCPGSRTTSAARSRDGPARRPSGGGRSRP